MASPMNDPAVLLAELVRKVLEGHSVDLDVLQATSDSVLSDEMTGNEDLTAAIRQVASAAFAVSVYDDAESRMELENSTRAFQMVHRLFILGQL